jgi:predicted RNA-binding protein with PUA-like domain
MAYWLLKSEPDVFSWDDLKKRGAKGEPWTGIRNHTAKLNMMKMKKGDRGFFYHSNIGKEIVGICEIVKAAYPDPTADPGTPWVCVDIKAVEPLKRPVTLADIKAEPKLSDNQLLKQSRLSVPAITDAEWKFVCKMGGL